MLGIEVNSESIDIIFENKINQLMKRENGTSALFASSIKNTNNNNIETSSCNGGGLDHISETVSNYSSASSRSFSDSVFKQDDTASRTSSTSSRRRQLTRIGSSVGDFYDPDSDKSLLFSKTGELPSQICCFNKTLFFYYIKT